jgi:hypothetical protein
VPLNAIIVSPQSEHAQHIGAGGILSQYHYLAQEQEHQTLDNQLILEAVCFPEDCEVATAVQTVAKALRTQGLDSHADYDGDNTNECITVVKIPGTRSSASDKVIIKLKTAASVKGFLDGTIPIKLNVLTNTIRTSQSGDIKKLGRPLITKYPGRLNLSAQEMKDCHYIIQCDAFANMHGAEVNQVLRMMLRSLTTQLPILPADLVPRAVECIQNLQVLVEFTWKQFGQDIAHVFATNPTIATALPTMQFPTSVYPSPPGTITVRLPGYGLVVLKCLPYIPPLAAPLQLFMRDKFLRTFAAKARGIAPEKANNRVMGHLSPEHITQMQQALHAGGVHTVAPGPGKPAVQQVSMYSGTKSRGALVITCLNEASYNLGKANGLRLVGGIILTLTAALSTLPDFVPVPRTTDPGKRPRDEEEPNRLGDDLASVSPGHDDRSNRGRNSRGGGPGRGAYSRSRPGHYSAARIW